MATQIIRPQPAPPPRGYRRSMERAPLAVEDKGPVAEYAPPEVEAYNKDMRSDDPYGVEQIYTQPPPAPTQAPGYQRYSGGNSGDMIRNDRDFAYGRGDELYQNAKDRTANESQVRANYRAYSDEVYDPLIGGRGGYNPDEARAINNAGDLDPYMTSGQEYSDNFLTDEEIQQQRGNPNAGREFFNPGDDMDREYESATRQRGAVDDMSRGMYESLDGQLGLSDDYSTGVDRTVSGTADRVRGAYDPATLRADRSSLDRIRMTPEEEQDIITKGGISGGMKYKAAAGELDRRARAAGIDPLGAAAMRGRYLRDSAADSADAMTSARVQASKARAGREGTAENLRMSGERTAADIGTSTEMSLGDQALAATTNREKLRLGSQQDIATRRQQIARDAGTTRLDMEQDVNAQQRQQRQYNTTTGTNLAVGADKEAAARAAAIAANRQTVARGNQATRFQQGATRVGVGSEQATTVANARRADAQEGREYLREQSGVANANTQNDLNRQANVYATQVQGGQAATNAQQRKDEAPKWWEKVIGAGVGALGAVTGTGGLASLTGGKK